MALYAFDGTWNSDKPGAERDTNVRKFCEAYQGAKFYLAGVGTRFGNVGKIAGGITGAGGRSRVKKMLEHVRSHARSGDTQLDVIGFSRGAALALHFANAVEQEGEQLTGTAAPRIRFLGLWDTVPSFGLPSVRLNIGWDLDLPDNVVKCFHALALDERRHTFRLHRLEAKVADAMQEGRLFEVWFRGVHSDVGGGNKNPGLSTIALNWMFAKAVACGLPIEGDAVAKNAARLRPERPISVHEYDLVKGRFRTVRWNDQVHYSVAFRNDTRQRQYNNAPENVVLVNDEGVEVGRFLRAAA
ncbi:MAG: fructose-bisphosphate aldolase [Luteitalea sp.]|nr:fructose-bisphosphate aldolase [Luteitalea sp.]